MRAANENELKIEFREAISPEEMTQVRELFLEYAQSLNFDLCFQSFDEELAALPGDYAPPEGKLLVAYVNDNLAGCAALRKCICKSESNNGPFVENRSPINSNDHSDEVKEERIGEMKRLFVRGNYRNLKLGKKLAQGIIDAAKQLGYERIRLDTVPNMKAAIALYKSLGFKIIDPYTHNPVCGAIFLELELG